MKFVYFKMFSEVLRNRLQVLYMWEPAWYDSVFNCPPLTTWLWYVVKSLNLLHDTFMFIIFLFSVVKMKLRLLDKTNSRPRRSAAHNHPVRIPRRIVKFNPGLD